MPELVAAGDVFRLGAAGEFDGVWYTSGFVRGSAGISYEGRAELCHGLDVAVGIEASAEIEAALTVFLPSVQAEGRLFAAAGAELHAQVAPNIFDKVGLTVDVHAFAQASAAGRIGVALDFTEIAGLARGQLDDLSYGIFIAFLNEVIVQAGVWGRASFAAMAQAHLEINGTLTGDDPGFQIGAGAGAGWGGGTAWDFFARVGLEDPRRFYTTAVELIVAELAHRARAELGAEHESKIEVFEFVTPIAAVTAFDLGEMAAEELLRPANQSVQPFLEAFAQRVALYTLDKIVELGTELLSSALTDALSRVASSPLDAGDRELLQQRVQEAIDILGDGPLELDKAVDVLGPVTDILEILAQNLLEQWDDELAIVWSAAVAARSLRRAAASAGITVNVLGLGAGTSASALTVPPAPAAVVRAYDRHFSPGPPQIGFSDVVDFLVEAALGDLLERHVPAVAATLGQVAAVLDLTLGDVVEAALTGAVGEDLTATDLYGKLRDFTKSQIEGVVIDELLPEMKTALSGTPEAVLYIDEVIEPILLGTSVFAFDRVDHLVSGISVNEFNPFNESFKAGLGDLVWLAFSRNVVFLADVLVDRAVDSLNQGFVDLEDAVRSEPGHAMATAAVGLADAAFGPFNGLDEDHVEALRHLVADLAGAGATAFGPAIWTNARRTKLKSLTHRLLERGAAADYGDPSATQQALSQLADCYYVPDVDGITQLIGELAGLTADEFEVVMQRVVPAFELFFLRLTTRTLDDLEEGAIELVAGAAELLREAWDALQEVAELLNAVIEELAHLGIEVGAALSAISEELASATWRNSVLNALLAQGMDVAEQNTRAGLGFSQLPEQQQNQAVAGARGGFSVAFNLIRPALDLGLQAAGGVLATAADVVEAAASAPQAAGALTTALSDAVVAELDVAGIVLPPALTIDDVEAAVIDALSTAGVRQLIDDYIVKHQSELDTAAEKDRLEDEHARLENEHAEEQQLSAGLVGEPPEITIVSPAPIHPERGFVYPREVPAYARIAGARLSYVTPGSPKRVLVALNGSTVTVPASDWSVDDSTEDLVLRTNLTDHLRPGMNTLEVSVVDGVTAQVRSTVAFLANPDLEPRGADLVIAGDLSQFDAPGDDHVNTSAEWVTLRNNGDQSLDLDGLRVADRIGHVYVFADVELLPQQSIDLHTGTGTDQEGHVYWGRGQAVWNNRGDAVYVYDAHRVLWAEHTY